MGPSAVPMAGNKRVDATATTNKCRNTLFMVSRAAWSLPLNLTMQKVKIRGVDQLIFQNIELRH